MEYWSMCNYRVFRCRKNDKISIILSISIITVLACLIIFLYFGGLSSFKAYYLVQKYSKDLESSWSQSHPRTILLWTKIWGNDRWYMDEDTMGPEYLRDEFKCHEYNCIITNERKLMPSIELYDAVLFHTAQSITVPPRRSADQLYVFAQMESPGATYHNLAKDHSFYNLSMTYRLDSDILWPYSFIADKETGQLIAPAFDPHWKKPPMEYNDTGIWATWLGKTKSVVWFVSHCNAMSDRDKLAKALQQYIDVDIYGKCGTLSCERYSHECDELLDRDYKFYLAFENALCIDYVTEKVYDQLKRSIIPIVYGGAMYSRFLPPHSYIDAESFDTAADLAEYLQHLAKSPAEYMKYFWWREHYQLSNYNSFCDLCELLNNPRSRHKQQVYGNIEKWWYDGACRIKSKIKY